MEIICKKEFLMKKFLIMALFGVFFSIFTISKAGAKPYYIHVISTEGCDDNEILCFGHCETEGVSECEAAPY